MSIGVLAAVLALASFAALSGVAYAIHTSRMASLPKYPGARVLFLHATAPTIVPALIAFALLLPSFLMHEQPREEEWTGFLLPLLSIAGAARLIQIGARAARAVHSSRVLVRTWQRHATPLPHGRWGAAASQIDVGVPVVAVSGFLRPHVFVDRRVLETCSDTELDAIAAHERAHISSHDNLRRLLVAACTGHTSELAMAWRVAAEWSADDRAVQSPHGAVDLARALVRLARCAPAPSLPVAAISTIHDGGSLEQRVQRLLEFSPAEQKARTSWSLALMPTSAALGMAMATPLPRALHAGLELLVQHLP